MLPVAFKIRVERMVLQIHPHLSYHSTMDGDPCSLPTYPCLLQRASIAEGGIDQERSRETVDV